MTVPRSVTARPPSDASDRVGFVEGGSTTGPEFATGTGFLEIPFTELGREGEPLLLEEGVSMVA